MKPQNFLLFMILCSSLLCISCNTGLEHESPSGLPPSPTLQMDPEERALVVTNDLFAAIVDNRSQEKIEEILLTPGNTLYSLNQNNDTPLGVAIQFRRKELAVFFLERLQCDDLYHQNNKGESYVYLSAEHGYHELIRLIANKCYERKAPWSALFQYDYEFSDLDPETLKGEKAVHSSYDSAVMDALNEEYWRGALEWPFWVFYETNNEEETFFHTAVRDGRDTVIEWGVKTFCQESSWEKSEQFYKNLPTSVPRRGWHFLQTQFSLNLTQLINFGNKEDNTALHLASQSLNLKAIRLIADCRWTDYSLENSLGNIPLQEFLKALDPSIQNYEEEIKTTFLFLMKQETYLKLFTNIPGQVNHQNEEEDSSLHIAAGLADKFFYNELKKVGNIHLPNKKNQTPETIVKTTHTQLQRD
ncbi:MAG: hypothetical protein OXB86_00350 [Bdellovibrionales bacterium]|nr:hypothetical protein [Bdellovibrionales bacterium]